MFKGEVDVILWGYQFKVVVDVEFIFDCYGCQWVVMFFGEFVDKLLVFGDGVVVFVVLIIVMGMVVQEVFGVFVVGQFFQGFQQVGIEWFVGGGIVDCFVVNLSGVCVVVEGFGVVFDFQ